MCGDSMATLSDVMNLIPRLNYDHFTDLANALDISPDILYGVTCDFLSEQRRMLEEEAKLLVKESK